MATLQIEFNCLCMFVRDRASRVVHVLMPSTHHAPDHADHHVVRLIHPSFGAEPQGRSMIGWALALGPAQGAADVSLRPAGGNGAIADLSAAAGSAVERGLVERPDARIASRVTLRAGRIVQARAERTWMLDGREVSMAHRVVWEMENVSETEPLPWRSLGAAGPPPLGALNELAPEASLAGERVYRLRVFHTTPGALPPNDRRGTLDPATLARHFAHYYTLVGIPHPASHLLPALVEESRRAAAGRGAASLAALGALGLAWRRGGMGEDEGAMDRRRFVIGGGVALGAMLLFGRSAEAWGADGTAIGKVNCAVGGGDLQPPTPGTASAGGGWACLAGGGELSAGSVGTAGCLIGGGEVAMGAEASIACVVGGGQVG
ncbi:MAG TPA: hypothetical protein VEX86_20155 [Longimicrobium sp.]|nr:hypothetical protein [Longimicrobium sp.]